MIDLPFEVDLPEGWHHRSDVPPFALIAQGEPGDDRFVPNLVVAVAPEAYLARQLDEAARTLTEPLLVDATADRRRRSVTFVLAHTTGGVDVTLAQHHVWVDDHRILAAAGTVSDARWPVLAADVMAMVGSVRPQP